MARADGIRTQLHWPRESWRRWRVTAACLATTVLCMVALVWLSDRSQRTRLGQSLDQAGMDIVVGDQAATRRLVGVLGNVSLGSVAVVVALLIGVAVLRQRYAAAAAASAIVLGANVTTQAIKALSDRPNYGFLTAESFPSGHATVVASLVLAALLVAPDRVRTTVSLVGSAVITVTAAATLVASWHRPADILGALLVSLAWGTLIVAGWSVVRGGTPEAVPGRPHRVFAVTGVVLAAAGLLALGVRPDGGWSGLLDAGVVLAAIALASALVVTTFAQLSAPMAVGVSAGARDASGDADQTPLLKWWRSVRP